MMGGLVQCRGYRSRAPDGPPESTRKGYYLFIYLLFSAGVPDLGNALEKVLTELNLMDAYKVGIA